MVGKSVIEFDQPVSQQIQSFDIDSSQLTVRFSVRDHTNDAGVVRYVLSDAYRVPHTIIRPGDTIVDVGAHIGSFSIYMAMLHEVTVYSYEALPDNYELLCYNIELNLDHMRGHVLPFNEAVWGFDLPELAVGYNLHRKPNRFIGRVVPPASRDNPIMVPAISLESIFIKHQMGGCRVLKIDVEGSERDILKDTPPSVFDSVDFIAIEIHGNEPRQVVEFTSRFSPAFNIEWEDAPKGHPAVAFCTRKEKGVVMAANPQQVNMDEYPIVFEEIEIRRADGFATISLAFREGTNDSNVFEGLRNDRYGILDLPFEAGDVVIDLGSHVGFFGLLLASRYSVEVYSYEVLPENVELNRYLVEANKDILKGNIHLNQMGVWMSFPKRQRFYYNDDTDSGRIHKFIGSSGTADSANPYQVIADTITLPEIFEQNDIAECKVLKCDIEGSEWVAFNNKAFEIIAARVRFLVIELHASEVRGVPVDASTFKDRIEDSFRVVSVLSEGEPQTILFENRNL